MKSYFYGFRSSRPTPQHILLSLAWSQVKRRSKPARPIENLYNFFFWGGCSIRRTWAPENLYNLTTEPGHTGTTNQSSILGSINYLIPRVSTFFSRMMKSLTLVNIKFMMFEMTKNLRERLWRLKYLGWKLLFNTRHFGIILTSTSKGISTLDIPECLKQHSNYT